MDRHYVLPMLRHENALDPAHPVNGPEDGGRLRYSDECFSECDGVSWKNVEKLLEDKL